MTYNILHNFSYKLTSPDRAWAVASACLIYYTPQGALAEAQHKILCQPFLPRIYAVCSLVIRTATWDIKISQYSSPWHPIRKLLNSMVENIRLLQVPLGAYVYPSYGHRRLGKACIGFVSKHCLVQRDVLGKHRVYRRNSRRSSCLNLLR
jgi:hypothetical protein